MFLLFVSWIFLKIILEHNSLKWFFQQKTAVMDRLVFLSTSEEALDDYKALSEELERSELQRMSSLPAEAPHLGSAPLQQV